MGIFASIKAAFSALGALFGLLDRRSIRRDAKAAAYWEQDRATLKLARRVRADVPADVRDSVWDKLQAKRRTKSK